jgi:hypothetical protein
MSDEAKERPSRPGETVAPLESQRARESERYDMGVTYRGLEVFAIKSQMGVELFVATPTDPTLLELFRGEERKYFDDWKQPQEVRLVFYRPGDVGQGQWMLRGPKPKEFSVIDGKFPGRSLVDENSLVHRIREQGRAEKTSPEYFWRDKGTEYLGTLAPADGCTSQVIR